MKRVAHLFERVASFESLCAAARAAARGKRLSREAAAFLFDLEPEVLMLERELREASYLPGAYRTFRIIDPKPRTISAALFRDRVVHHALCAALEPVFERYATDDSFACRRAKGTTAALARVRELSRRHAWFVKLDVRHYFETLDHDVLRRTIKRLVKDGRVLELADCFIAAGAPGSPGGKGVPIGNLTSQHFANLYLGVFDHFVREVLRVPGYCRYMDDMVLFGDSRELVRGYRSEAERYLEQVLRLEVKQTATRLAPVTNGVPFLGFRVWPRQVRFDAARARRFRRRFRALDRAVESGAVDEDVAAQVAQSLIAWAANADTVAFRASFFGRPTKCLRE